jgi:hypothetical protein
MKRSHCHNVVFLIISGQPSWEGVILFSTGIKIEPILQKNGLFVFFFTTYALRFTEEDLRLTVRNLAFKFWLEERTREQLKGQVW